jgi:hypothetical protein
MTLVCSIITYSIVIWSIVLWWVIYVIAMYVNFWSWHVHGSHLVYLPKPGVTRRLGHYFEAYNIRVPTDRGINDLFRNPKTSVRRAKWAAELSSYNIIFKPSSAIKSQVIVDFIVDRTGPSSSNNHNIEALWTIHCDDAWSNAGDRRDNSHQNTI